MLVALGAALVPLALMAPPEAALQQQVIDQNSLAYMGNRWEIDHLQIVNFSSGGLGSLHTGSSSMCQL